ncbi:hypothetical protein C8Q76DRAFT_695189 [Earliella scabrosa]|nr:hypothetical protein C8Q76DRAFT_695189 [Earliella scabrosa]
MTDAGSTRSASRAVSTSAIPTTTAVVGVLLAGSTCIDSALASRFPLDIVVNIARLSDFKTMARWRRTSRALFAVIGATLRKRYFSILADFVTETDKLDLYARVTGAAFSGSAAIHFFLPDEPWTPGDLDVYVPDVSFPAFVAAVTAPAGLGFELIPRPDRKVSPSLQGTRGFKEVLRYKTREGKEVDIIRSPTDSAIDPLNVFWSTVVKNFICPEGAGCGFPDLTMVHTGVLKAGELTKKDEAAVQKYERRGFTFINAPWWYGMDDDIRWERNFFGDKKPAIVDFRTSPTVKAPRLPIFYTRHGWRIHHEGIISIGEMTYTLHCIGRKSPFTDYLPHGEDPSVTSDSESDGSQIISPDAAAPPNTEGDDQTDVEPTAHELLAESIDEDLALAGLRDMAVNVSFRDGVSPPRPESREPGPTTETSDSDGDRQSANVQQDHSAAPGCAMVCHSDGSVDVFDVVPGGDLQHTYYDRAWSAQLGDGSNQSTSRRSSESADGCRYVDPNDPRLADLMSDPAPGSSTTSRDHPSPIQPADPASPPATRPCEGCRAAAWPYRLSECYPATSFLPTRPPPPPAHRSQPDQRDHHLFPTNASEHIRSGTFAAPNREHHTYPSSREPRDRHTSATAKPYTFCGVAASDHPSASRSIPREAPCRRLRSLAQPIPYLESKQQPYFHIRTNKPTSKTFHVKLRLG